MWRVVVFLVVFASLASFSKGDILRKSDGSVHRGVLETSNGERVLYTGVERIRVEGADDVQFEAFDQSWLHVAQRKFESGDPSGASEALQKVDSSTRGYTALRQQIDSALNEEVAEQRRAQRQAQQQRQQANAVLGFSLIGCVGIAILVVLGIALYFLPTIIACRRNHPHSTPIFVANLLLGATGIFWALTLVWSLVDYIPVVMRYDGPPMKPNLTPDGNRENTESLDTKRYSQGD